MNNPTTEQLNNITIEALDRSYGSLVIDQKKKKKNKTHQTHRPL